MEQPLSYKKATHYVCGTLLKHCLGETEFHKLLNYAAFVPKFRLEVSISMTISNEFYNLFIKNDANFVKLVFPSHSVRN